MTIAVFFNELRYNNGAIWLDNGKLKLSTPVKLQTKETKDFVIQNESEIRRILDNNQIFDKQSFSNNPIFKTHSKESILSSAQERLWFIEAYESGTNAYHIPLLYELDTDTKTEGLEYAIQQIVLRHEVLRSTIDQGTDIECGMQKVHERPLQIEEVHLTYEQDYKALIKNDIDCPFDLSKEYPIRARFYTIAAVSESSTPKTLLSITMHHIASDGWSVEIFEKELISYYEAYVSKDTTFCLPPLAIQYKDYAIWQKSFLIGEAFNEQLSYWKNKLSGYQVLELPTDYARPSKINYKGDFYTFKINKEISQRLRLLAQNKEVTLNSVMLSSLSVLLGKYTDQDDIVIGSPIANRHHQQTEGLIGFFVNTQANRILLNNSQSFEELMEQVHQDQVEAQLYQDLPFEKLVDALRVERDSSRHPIFQVMFGVQSIGNKEKKANSEKKHLWPYEVKDLYEIEKFDFSVSIDDSQEELSGEITYATSLFTKDTIARLADHYIYLLDKLIQEPNKAHSEIALLSPIEYNQIVYDWNTTDKEYQKGKTIHQLFQAQVEEVPGNIALVYGNQKLSYAELNEKSNQLARHIRKQFEKRKSQEFIPDTFIAICMDRSLEMVIGTLAILKAGFAYAPIDPNYPQDRIDYILEDTQAELILTQNCICENHNVKLPSDKVINIDLSEDLYAIEDNSNLPNTGQSTDLAYVIYTSGTTGKPKGVMVEHRNILSLVYNDYITLSDMDVFAFLSSPVFDAATFELFVPLLNGNKLIIPSEIKSIISNINEFKHFLESNAVSVLWLTKTLFENLYYLDNNLFENLNYLIIGGEELDKRIVNKLINSNSKPQHFLNGYGPTESTTFTCTYEMVNTIDGMSVPIGKPINNRNVYILSQNHIPTPIGVVGELYIGGEGLSRGYLNRTELTAERFIKNPFATEVDKVKGNTRLYKTGDLVRWLPDGNIEYIGRNDDQVKIHGYRIELGEIEHAMSQIEGVEQVCVLTKSRQTETGVAKSIVGYYVLDSKFEVLTSAEIQNKLSQVLPNYMVPGSLMAIESFPLTINGKLDKQALPDPEFNSSETAYVKPSTELEKQVCEIWQKLLGLNQVGITNDFFRLGGNSILAIQISHRMSKLLRCNVKVSDIFKYKTIAQLLINVTNQSLITIPKVTTDNAVLSFAQERLWFIEQYEEGTSAYHIPSLFELDINTDKEGIKQAIEKIVSRHEVLRSTIEKGENQSQTIQVVHNKALLVKEINLKDSEDYESFIKAEIDRPFNLSLEYPIRACFYNIESSLDASIIKTILLINIHHIASDGWSTNLFEKELATYYEDYLNNNSISSLPALEIQYKDYAVWQRTYLIGETLSKQLNYWKEKLSGYQTLEFPTDYSRPTEINYQGENFDFSINQNISSKLRSLSQRNGVSLNSVLLSSVNILLSKYTGQEDIVIGGVIANRHHQQTEGNIGFFVNTQANRTFLSSSQSFDELIQKVHEDQIEAQLHQDLPFEKLVDELVVERDVSRHPIFQILFELQSNDTKNNSSTQQKEYLKPYLIDDVVEAAKFDLSIYINDNDGVLSGQINYATSLFSRDTIVRLSAHFVNLLEQLIEEPMRPYSEFSLLVPDEHKKIMYDWNSTDREYLKEKAIYQLFQEQVLKTPNAIAIAYEGKMLNYLELNEKSNQVARYIRKQYRNATKKELEPGSLIALHLNRGLEMIIGIIAVFKAGGAYVPMDPSYPQDRIKYILEDTQAELILNQIDITESDEMYDYREKIINIALTEELYKTEDNSNLPEYSTSDDLAYVIYTSGTTGKPKGVLINNRSVINLTNFHNRRYSALSSNLQVALLSNYIFDFSVQQIFNTLLYGHTLHITPSSLLLNPSEFNAYLKKNKIEVFEITPILFSHLILPFDNYYDSDLKLINIGGENLLASTISEFFRKKLPPQISVINTYGPTEYTVDATSYEINNTSLSVGEQKSVLIGKPLDNTRIYILDSNNSPVPIGVIGELHIGGAGLAVGYLNRPDLTAERFITNPFATEADLAEGYTKLYKTGDLVRWSADGNIEYIGRNDDQVKILGHRIELGEIEHAISQLEGIKQAFVLVKERQTATITTKYLVGYYVADNDAKATSQTIILDELSKVLPEYMVPDYMIVMESFPLTINGKLDKRSFPEPDFSVATDHIKPETELEIKLCAIYAEVLGLTNDQISTQQNFFRMGGNSILSIQLKNKLNELDEFKNISIANLFKYNSIQKLIQSLAQDTSKGYNLQKNRALNHNHEIAIIGMSGAYSGANNLSEFWKLIENKQEGVQFFNKTECEELGVDKSLLEDVNYIPVSGLVKGIQEFDPLFWDISPLEAKQLDPQIRKFIEHCWYALESAGYINKRKNKNIGVFAGSGSSDYFYEHILNGEMANQINMWDASTSNSKDALATKTAYFLGLTGPANSVNTACSTGLVSVVEACQKLQLATCDMALAGGVSIALPDQVGYVYQEGMILSKDGHCRTFDEKASGTTAGSGVGVFLLKRLEDAINDGDPIIGVIKGFATNNDGDRKTGYTAPSVIGQTECIINAQRMAGISSNDIDYVECHGTATHLGDPIEVQALREAFAFNHDKERKLTHKTVLGAVKANIGHVDSAAGTASLMKVCAMLQNNTMPGQANFESPNAELQLEQTNFEIIKTNRDWPAIANRPRLAGVSSFGIGGTNAHVIIGDYVPTANEKIESELDQQTNSINYIVPLSAKSKQSLNSYRQALLNFLSDQNGNKVAIDIKDIAYTLQERRDCFSYRNAYCATNVSELIDKLKEDTGYAQVNEEVINKIVFMFPGQGSQYVNMAKAFYEHEPVFKNTVDQCIAIANLQLNTDLAEVMFPTAIPTHNIGETQWTQISLFIIEYGISKYLDHIGVKADAYIGHSIGEYVAATLAGVFSLEDAIHLVISRGKLMQSMEPGSMLAVNSNEQDIQYILNEYECEIAVINSSEDLVVSGSHEKIQDLKEELDSKGIASVKLQTSHAYHSVMMEKAADEFEKVFKTIKLNKPTGKFISNLTGEFANEEVVSATYWCNQLRNTVQFFKGIDTISNNYNHQVSFIEVGVGKSLCSFVNNYKKVTNYKSIQTIQLFPSAKEDKVGEFNHLRNKEELIAKLWMNGIVRNPNDTKLFKQTKLQIGLPVYQFDFQKCWFEKANNILSNTNKDLIIGKFKDEIEQRDSMSNADLVRLLEKLLSQDAEIIPNEIVQTEISLLEEDVYTETEYQIAQIFAKILGVEQLSIHDDFFRLGGNSILAIQLARSISTTLDFEVVVADVFRLKSCKALAENVQVLELDSENVQMKF